MRTPDKVEDDDEDYYDEDFESLSKSQVFVKQPQPPPPAKPRIDTADSYSQEQFESMTLSGAAAATTAEEIRCFLCK